MSKQYLSVLCEVTSETDVEVHYAQKSNEFHVWIGKGLSKVTLIMSYEQIDRLASMLRVAQVEQDIRSGKARVPDDDGPVLGGEPAEAMTAN